MSSSKKLLDSFERSKILEIYFLRIQGRSEASVLENCGPLFDLELDEIKSYLINVDPKDSVLSSVLHLTETA